MFCPKCGKQNQQGNRFCKFCGRQFTAFGTTGESAGESQAPLPQPPPQNLHQVFDGKYGIERKIGTGGMGELYLAKRLLVGDHVAIKLLRSHLRTNPAYVERFRLEALAATKIRHRNVIAIYDVGVSKEKKIPYILMEYADGPTLRQFLNVERHLPSVIFFSLAEQICNGLQEAHQLGIIHRDIKPENIMVKRVGNDVVVKILDFGIAKMTELPDSAALTNESIVGTPNYMSPEQCVGQPAMVESDIYSLGVVLYELLTGQVPFTGDSLSAIIRHHRETPPVPPRVHNPEVPEMLEAAIMRAMAKDPIYRFRSVQEMNTALQSAKQLLGLY